MHKAMLVDDEILILKGLQNILDWDRLGVKIVETASNGEEGYKKYMECKPDIVITDINMPKLTGLQLIEKLKRENEKAKFIILSGHDEFSYAKQAIKYGVENYILKPINEEELEEAVKEIVKSIEKEQLREKTILEKNSILTDMLRGHIGEDVTYNFKEILKIDFESKVYTVAIFILNNVNKENLLVNFRNLISNNNKENIEILKKDDGSIVVINSWNKKVDNIFIKEYYDSVRKKMSEFLKCEVFVAIGDGIETIGELHNSYSVAKSLKKYILTKGYNVSIDKFDVLYEKENNRTFDREIDILSKLIIHKEVDKISEAIREFYDDNDLTPKNIYDMTIKILLLIERISAEFNLDNKYSRQSLTEIITRLSIEQGKENIKNFIINEINEISTTITRNTTKYSPIVQQIINVVNNKYYEELSLKTLADSHNINRSYLGQIFTKEVGMSFSEYLNKIKNEKAKEFILNTNMKITDISKKVGYPDTSYFYRKFKKYYGVCPSTLRELKNY